MILVRSVLHLSLLSFTAILACACSSTTSSSSSGSTTSSSGGSSSGDPAVSASDCKATCESKASQCGAPTDVTQQRCGQICGGTVTQSQLTCLSGKSCNELMAIDDQASLNSVCPASASTSSSSSSSSSSGGTAGNFGDACKCNPDSTSGASEFECSGTGICSPGLSCVGTRVQGVDQGKCVGPVCCSGQADCAAKLGKQSNCPSGQKCACTRGDLECVGDKCTCASGVAGSRGLCYPG